MVTIPRATAALREATGELASLDADIDQLTAALRAFRIRAARITRKVAARSESLAEAIHAARDERVAANPDADPPAPDRAEEVRLDQLADLPSCSPDDVAAAAIESLADYRLSLHELAAAVGALTAGPG